MSSKCEYYKCDKKAEVSLKSVDTKLCRKHFLLVAYELGILNGFEFKKLYSKT